MRAAGQQAAAERDNCSDWLERELALLERARVIVCLGQFAWNLVAPGRGREFGHGAEARAGRYALLGCFHPSQQNTFTGKLTAPMIEAVLRRARELADAAVDEIVPAGDEGVAGAGRARLDGAVSCGGARRMWRR